MKIFPLAAAVVLSSSAPAFAIKDAEIVPAALAGRTLTFTIVNGSTPYATKGRWSGVFGSAGKTFAVSRITGDTVNVSTTCSAAINGTFTEVSLGKFIEGLGPATLTLYTMAGVGHWEVAIPGLIDTGINGTFTFSSKVAKAPEIDVLNAGKKLTDGSAKVGFDKAKPGKSTTEKLIIKNTGKANLTGLAITRNGADKADFSVGALPRTRLAAGDSMTVTVKFKPGAKGRKAAAIHIRSNDANENPFDIKLAGTATK